MAGAVGLYRVTGRLLPCVENPPHLFFATYVAVEAIIAASVALTGSLWEATVCLSSGWRRRAPDGHHPAPLVHQDKKRTRSRLSGGS